MLNDFREIVCNALHLIDMQAALLFVAGISSLLAYSCDVHILEDCVTGSRLLLRSDAVTSRLANGSAAFISKLHCYWLRGLRQSQIKVVIGTLAGWHASIECDTIILADIGKID